MFGAFFLLSLSSFFPNIFGALFTERHNKQKEPFKITTPDDEEEVNWTVGQAQMCANSVYYHKCNNHLDSNLHCQCAPTDSDVRVRQLVFFSPLPSCSAALPQVELPNEQLLTFGIAFPVVGQFLKDPEGVFLEDLELYTFIPKECVLIYRRGCSADGKAYEFQIGIISSKCTQFREVPIEQHQLKSLSPLMFLANPSFMMDNALKVAYVRKAV
uniref:Phlebovirus glycoprotein G2 fusion domain-containing protein n=1 Tax=Globodera pallida TaxID=36090 RepID=A0A183BVL9_GLOPA